MQAQSPSPLVPQSPSSLVPPVSIPVPRVAIWLQRSQRHSVEEPTLFANFEMTLTWPDLIKRTFNEILKDDAQGLASQLAYYFFLALFPALLCMLAIASFFPLQNFTDEVVRTLGPFAPREMIDIIRREMVQIAQGNHGGLFTIGLLG